MIARVWVALQIFIIGCVTIEVGLFLRKLDHNLQRKLSSPESCNGSQLLQDIAAYSFNIARLLRLFKLKRENVMETAKCLHNEEHPLFIRNFSCEQVKLEFKMSEREYKILISFMEKITNSLNDFYKSCEENPGFVGVPLPKPVFSLEKHEDQLEAMFKHSDPNVRTYMVVQAAEDYYYTLGKFTKKFILGRRAVMERAMRLFESSGPKFLKHYNYFKIAQTYKMSRSEAAYLNNLIYKIKKRYHQFVTACCKNPKFDTKLDFSSVRIVRNCEKGLNDILSHPCVNLTTQLFKHVREMYHVLGFLRRYNISNKYDLLKAVFQAFGASGPILLRPIDFDKLKKDFNLDEEMAYNVEDYIGHVRRRFNQVNQIFQNYTGNPMSKS